MRLLTIDKKIIDIYPQRKAWGFTLKELKNLLNGAFELLLLDSGDYLLFRDENDGEINDFATQLAKNIGHWDRPIFGPVVLARCQEIET